MAEPITFSVELALTLIGMTAGFTLFIALLYHRVNTLEKELHQVSDKLENLRNRLIDLGIELLRQGNNRGGTTP